MPPRQWKSEKPKDTKGVLLRIAKYLSKEKWGLLLCLVMAVASNVLNLYGPYLSGKAIDAIGLESGVDFDTVLKYCAMMIGFYVISSLMLYILAQAGIQIVKRMSSQLRKDIFDKLVELPVGYFDTHQAGDIVSRISYDVDTLNASLTNDVLQIVVSLITIIGSLIMMISISVQLVLIFVITVPVSILFTLYLTKKVKPLFSKRSRKLGEMNGFVEEIIAGQRTIKVYNQEEVMISRFDERNKEAVDAYYEADYYGSMSGPSVNFINNLSLALVSIVGALLYLSSSITIGNLSSFVLYSRKFSGPINESANIISEIQSALAAAERVFKLIDEEPEPKDQEDAVNLEHVQGKVELKHIQFGYVEGKTIIHDLNLHVEKGKLIAIVGPTGAGKTTLINLLMRFYDPQKGSIELDGHNICQVTRKSLRLAYAMVLQDTWLFHGTVFENIAYGKKDATMEEVIEVAKMARIHETITKLPLGYETILNEEGLNISQGQKQLLTIARAMLLEAPMLILDEATSNVDTRTEAKIQEAMQKLMEHKTCFVIAHRLSTIQNADTILVVKEGEIIEQGNHTDLINKKGVYAGLYNSQFS